MRSFLEAEEDVARMRDFVTKNNRISASGIVLFIRTQVIYSYQTTLLRTLGYTRRFFQIFLLAHWAWQHQISANTEKHVIAKKFGSASTGTGCLSEEYALGVFF